MIESSSVTRKKKMLRGARHIEYRRGSRGRNSVISVAQREMALFLHAVRQQMGSCQNRRAQEDK